MGVIGLFEYCFKKSFEMCKVVAVNMLFLELDMSLMGSAYLRIIWNRISCSGIFILPNFPVLPGTENKGRVIQTKKDTVNTYEKEKNIFFFFYLMRLQLRERKSWQNLLMNLTYFLNLCGITRFIVLNFAGEQIWIGPPSINHYNLFPMSYKNLSC